MEAVIIFDFLVLGLLIIFCILMFKVKC